MTAADFFTVETWTARGLITHYVLFLIDHGTRAVHIAGITPNPDERFMSQVARNLTDCLDGVLRGTRYLLLDRDSKFSAQFRCTIINAGIEVIRTAVTAPNMNAFAERFVRSIKSECLGQDDPLRRAEPPTRPHRLRRALPRRTPAPRRREHPDPTSGLLCSNLCSKAMAPMRGSSTPSCLARLR